MTVIYEIMITCKYIFIKFCYNLYHIRKALGRHVRLINKRHVNLAVLKQLSSSCDLEVPSHVLRTETLMHWISNVVILLLCRKQCSMPWTKRQYAGEYTHLLHPEPTYNSYKLHTIWCFHTEIIVKCGVLGRCVALYMVTMFSEEVSLPFSGQTWKWMWYIPLKRQ